MPSGRGPSGCTYGDPNADCRYGCRSFPRREEVDRSPSHPRVSPVLVTRRADDLGPTIVVVNPDEDCSAASGRLVIDEVLTSPVAPSPESLHARRSWLVCEARQPPSSSLNDSRYGSAI